MIIQDLQRDPAICGNCFRRKYDVVEKNYTIEGFGERHIWPKEVADNDELDIVWYDENIERIPSEQYRGMVNICVCGHRHSHEYDWRKRSLSKKETYKTAARVLERIEEYGLEFDEEVFWDTLKPLKKDPDMQFAADNLFMLAIEEAADIPEEEQMGVMFNEQ